MVRLILYGVCFKQEFLGLVIFKYVTDIMGPLAFDDLGFFLHKILTFEPNEKFYFIYSKNIAFFFFSFLEEKYRYQTIQNFDFTYLSFLHPRLIGIERDIADKHLPSPRPP